MCIPPPRETPLFCEQQKKYPPLKRGPPKQRGEIHTHTRGGGKFSPAQLSPPRKPVVKTPQYAGGGKHLTTPPTANSASVTHKKRLLFLTDTAPKRAPQNSQALVKRDTIIGHKGGDSRLQDTARRGKKGFLRPKKSLASPKILCLLQRKGTQSPFVLACTNKGGNHPSNLGGRAFCPTCSHSWRAKKSVENVLANPRNFSSLPLLGNYPGITTWV